MLILRRTLVGLTLAIAAIIGVAVRGADDDLSALQQRVDRLETLTARVEAVSAIKRLQYAYGHYAELGLWHDFADLFADTGIGHYTQGALDREGIRSLFLKEVGGGRVGLADGRIYPHISMQPVITLASDGQSAKGRWHIMAMLGGYGTSASWSGGVYENEYVRENGVWKMKDVRYFQQYSGRYENPGWTPSREPAPLHYEAAQVGKLNADLAGLGTQGSRLDLATLANRVADLGSRAGRLSEEIEVTNLQHEYGYDVDRKKWDEVADLFAADGTMEIGLQGAYTGRASIRRGLNPSTTLGVNDHIHLQTIVTVQPGAARTRGTDLGMTSAGGRALWSQSIYENAFERRVNGWKIKTMRVYPRFIVDAEKGWAKDAQPAPGPSRDFPPDRPSTETYEIYPHFHIAPFHFVHPVTGRPPQYPQRVKSAGAMSAWMPTVSLSVKTAAALSPYNTAAERSITRSLAYHASENLASAHGYSADEVTSSGLRIHQIVQPVIHVSSDGKTARIRARLFQLGGSPNEGAWTSGIYEMTSADDGGTWKLKATQLDTVWTAPSRGGWARVTTR